MAKRKKKAHHRRRRTVGAFSMNPASPVMKIAATAVGYLLADQINDAIDKQLASSFATTSTDAAAIKTAADNLDMAKTAVMAVEGLGGAYLLFKGKSSLVKTGIGGVLLGAGVKRAAKKYKVITGYQSVPVLGGRRRVNGYQSTPVIAGMPGQLQGAPDQLQGGFRVNGYMPTGSGAGVLGALYQDESGSGINSSDR